MAKQPLYLELRAHQPSGYSPYFGHVTLRTCFAGERNGDLVPEIPPSYAEEALPFRDIGVSAQIDSNATRDNLSYSWTVGLAEVGGPLHPVPVSRLAPAVKAIRRLDGAYKKVAVKFGDPKTFGQFVMFHFEPFKLAGIFLYRDTPHFRGWHMQKSDLTYAIDAEVLKIARACRKMAGKGEEIPAGRDD